MCLKLGCNRCGVRCQTFTRLYRAVVKDYPALFRFKAAAITYSHLIATFKLRLMLALVRDPSLP